MCARVSSMGKAIIPPKLNPPKAAFLKNDRLSFLGSSNND
ncbi:hypothetical protein ADICYQ_5533 [Cyclobacterium qasimii M12-11B]|uniref:Uncharacterized protein n=1 Tax=Cyclobacterium qasimii M12-11B TaxID=641524 RepID=S7V7P5_9BACT|nr:hypothetical protein ADICYQ_5533 [Cyclobacterium qasimii M12-11B]